MSTELTEAERAMVVRAYHEDSIAALLKAATRIVAAREVAARREALLEAAGEQGDPDSPWKVAADALCEYAEQQEERAKKAEAKIGRAIDWARIERGELGAAELRGILAELDDAPCSCGSRDATSLTPGERLHHSPDGCTIERGGEDGR